MKKLIKVSMLFIILIVLSSCKKEEPKTGSAMNELYGYWVAFDTADRRTDIDYSITSEDVKKDDSLHTNSDTFMDFSKATLNKNYEDEDEEYKISYNSKYINNGLICFRVKFYKAISYNYFKKIDKDTMIAISFYRSEKGNAFIHPETEYLESPKKIYRKVNKEQYQQLEKGINENDDFIIEEYNKIRSATLSKKNLKFYKKNFSGWNKTLTDKGEKINLVPFKYTAGKDAKTILDDYDKNTKNQ